MYGEHPADALGRFARQLDRSGSMTLGAGIGVERRGNREQPTYAVIHGGREKTAPGPLAAVTRAFELAGGTAADGTPGGKRTFTDAQRAARMYELEGEELRQQRILDETKPSSQFVPGRPDYETQRRERAEQRLQAIRREKARLVREETAMREAGTGKPGINWLQVSPDARKRINPIVQHYRKSAHPFSECVRDNTKRFGPERAKRVCAVVKDMGQGRTTWRKGGGKVAEELAALAAAGVARLEVVESTLGADAVRALIVEALEAREVCRGCRHVTPAIAESCQHCGVKRVVQLAEAENEALALGEALLAELAIVEAVGTDADRARWTPLLEAPVVTQPVLAAAAAAREERDEAAKPPPEEQSVSEQDEGEAKAERARDTRGQYAETGRGLHSSAGVATAAGQRPFRLPPAEAAVQEVGIDTPYERAIERAKRRNAKPTKGGGGSSRFDESKHRRASSGSPTGGQFVAKGGSGAAVRRVQRGVGVEADGQFGDRTKAAVESFQRKHGLTVDGIVGHQTALALAGLHRRARSADIGPLTADDRRRLGMSKGKSARKRPARRALGGQVV